MSLWIFCVEACVILTAFLRTFHWTNLRIPFNRIDCSGACESCPSSTTTMQMGIERVLKEKFGDAVKEIRQVYDDEVRETTAEVSSLPT